MTAHEARQTRVNTTAEALVGAANDVQSLLTLSFEGFRLGRLENLLRGLAVLAGIAHGTLGTRELGGGDDLHRVGDLLDVSNRLQTTFDLSQGGICSAILRRAIKQKTSQPTTQCIFSGWR